MDNLKLEYSELDALKKYIMSFLESEGHISVQKVFKDRQISCNVMGIDSPEMLYAVLQVQNDCNIELPRYPLIRAVQNKGEFSKSRSVISEVVNYIAQKNGPCSFDELESHFIKKLGYKSVYSVCIRSCIVRYSRGSVIHLDAVKWTDDKQYALEEEAQKSISQARSAGRCFSLIRDLLEYHDLPELANSVSWTQTLLAELLVRNGRFRVIGSARNAFVSIPNKEEIESFEDLVYELLRRDYDGACHLEQFANDLQQLGIIQKQLTPRMLNDQSKVCISGQIIMLTELCNNA